MNKMKYLAGCDEQSVNDRSSPIVQIVHISSVSLTQILHFIHGQLLKPNGLEAGQEYTYLS